jgi:regulator of sigma E protease
MFSPAADAGLKVGDVFLSANRKKISSFDDLKEIILNSSGSEVVVSFWREGNILQTTVFPEFRPTETRSGDIVEVMRIGVRGGAVISPAKIKPSVQDAIVIGFRTTFYIIKTSIIGVWRIIDTTISSRHLSGPVGVAKALSETAKEGFLPFLSLVGAISAGLGVVNLFPIPVLDGGHILFYIYEAIVKRPPSDMVLKYLMGLGVIFLVSLMIFATFNDIIR